MCWLFQQTTYWLSARDAHHHQRLCPPVLLPSFIYSPATRTGIFHLFSCLISRWHPTTDHLNWTKSNTDQKCSIQLIYFLHFGWIISINYYLYSLIHETWYIIIVIYYINLLLLFCYHFFIRLLLISNSFKSKNYHSFYFLITSTLCRNNNS